MILYCACKRWDLFLETHGYSNYSFYFSCRIRFFKWTDPVCGAGIRHCSPEEQGALQHHHIYAQSWSAAHIHHTSDNRKETSNIRVVQTSFSSPENKIGCMPDNQVYEQNRLSWCECPNSWAGTMDPIDQLGTGQKYQKNLKVEARARGPLPTPSSAPRMQPLGGITSTC